MRQAAKDFPYALFSGSWRSLIRVDLTSKQNVIEESKLAVTLDKLSWLCVRATTEFQDRLRTALKKSLH